MNYHGCIHTDSSIYTRGDKQKQKQDWKRCTPVYSIQKYQLCYWGWLINGIIKCKVAEVSLIEFPRNLWNGSWDTRKIPLMTLRKLAWQKIKIAHSEYQHICEIVYGIHGRVHSCNFWMSEPVFRKLGMDIMEPEPVSMAYLIITSICLCVCMCNPPIVARQRLGKMYPSYLC
jgi:hypothetical protein